MDISRGLVIDLPPYRATTPAPLQLDPFPSPCRSRISAFAAHPLLSLILWPHLTMLTLTLPALL